MKTIYHPVIKTAEPFLFPGDETGILLVHGFTGTPKELRKMGEYLANEGHTVLGIRLPGHANHPDNLRHLTWQDWLGAVEDGYHMLRSACQNVFIMGLSLGGVLTLTAGARLPFEGLVAMSTPYALPPDPRLPYLHYLAWLIEEMPKGPSDWHEMAMAEEHVDYPAYATRGLVELRDLLQVMREGLPKVRCPVLLAHSRQDGGVAPENMERIYAALGTKDKQMLWLDHSGHVVTCDLERSNLFKAAMEFLERVRSSQPEV